MESCMSGVMSARIARHCRGQFKWHANPDPMACRSYICPPRQSIDGAVIQRLLARHDPRRSPLDCTHLYDHPISSCPNIIGISYSSALDGNALALSYMHCCYSRSLCPLHFHAGTTSLNLWHCIRQCRLQVLGSRINWNESNNSAPLIPPSVTGQVR